MGALLANLVIFMTVLSCLFRGADRTLQLLLPLAGVVGVLILVIGAVELLRWYLRVLAARAKAKAIDAEFKRPGSPQPQLRELGALGHSRSNGLPPPRPVRYTDCEVEGVEELRGPRPPRRGETIDGTPRLSSPRHPREIARALRRR